ncbi:MAG: 6-bladed beta-propeller [Acidobacteria bacterium]|nr:6-bladed beta-propeller [Acidobacteriota bacterium]
MTLISLLLFCGQFLEPTATTQFAPLPEDSDYYLERPASVALDDQGRLYVADVEAGVIFRWSKDGKFLGTIGHPGQGPGEFQFQGRRGGGMAGLAIQKNQLYVIDSRRIIQVFDLEGKYLSSINPEARMGRMNGFYVTPDGQFIMQQMNFMSETPTQTLELFDEKANKVKELASFGDSSFKREGNAGGRPSGVTITAYSGSIASTYNAKTNQIIYGHGDKPNLTVLNLKDGKSSKIEVPIAQLDLAQADKDEFLKLPMFQNQGNFRMRADFPEKKAFFNRILTSQNSLLVYNESPFFHTISGVKVDMNGKKQGDIQLKCGENGSLFSADGNLIWVQCDEEGEISISQIQFGNQAGS